MGNAWRERFEREGRIWGEDPSPVGLCVEALTMPSSRVFEFGFAYGRDLSYLAARQRICTGLEHPDGQVPDAVSMIRDTHAINQHYSTLKDFAAHAGRFETVYSHRVIHLLDEAILQEFAGTLPRILNPGGYLVLSARDERGFDPNQMVWVKPDTARYTLPGRKDHVVHFWSGARFRDVFGSRFDILSFEKTKELEALSNPQICPLTLMIAKLK